MNGRGLAALAALSLLALACKSTELTQVIVVVDSDSDDFDHVQVSFSGLSHMEPVEIDVRRHALPRRVTLVHDGGPLGPFGVTVKAFAGGGDTPLLVEPRKRLFFVRGQASMLKIDLLRACIDQDTHTQMCDDDEACLAGPEGPRCVPSDDPDARELTEWNGRVPPIEAQGGGRDDAGAGMMAGSGGADDAGGAGNAGDDADVPDAAITNDAGPPDPVVPPAMPVARFPYEPANFDPLDPMIPATRLEVVLDCIAEPTFDSTNLSFPEWCGDPPFATRIEQGDGSPAALVVMDTLEVGAGTTLRLVGSLPVILAVYGDAHVLGAIDASAAGSVPGAGGDVDCSTAEGDSGEDVASGEIPGAGGGGGGAFGSDGGDGGGSDITPSATRGRALLDQDLSPLRGGCPGGSGGLGDGNDPARGGAGGGALQISAAGSLDVTGWIAANGAGGGATAEFRDGGGGGGSGGAILLEAVEVRFAAGALAVANGGGGGGGNATAGDLYASAGMDGAQSTASAAGGQGPYSGGMGGVGASRTVDAEDGEDADQSSTSEFYGAGGGGGGGRGVVLVKQMMQGCISGTFSPVVDNECAGACTDCYELPSSSCALIDSGSQKYVQCTDHVPWADAQASCESVGLTLVEVDDAAEQAFLAATVGSGYTWLGARDLVEGEWTWERGGATFFSEQTGQAVGGEFNSWAPMQPGFDTGEQDCMATSRMGWFDYPCEDTEEYLCEP